MFSCFIGTISSLIYNPKIGHGPDSKREMYFICTKLDNGWGDYGLDIINKGLKNKNQEQNEQGSLLIRWIPNLEKYVSYFSPLHHQPAVTFETGPLPVPVNQGSLNKCGTTHQRKVPTTTSVNKNVVDFIRLFNVYIFGSFWMTRKRQTSWAERA